VIDSPFVLAGLVIVIVAIVGGIAATIVRSRNDTSYSPPRGLSYEPPPDAGDADDPESADLSRLDALVAITPSPAAAHAEADDEPLDLPPPPPLAEAFAPDVVDDPADEQPTTALWSHLVTTEEGPLNVHDRLDMVARLEMVGEKWCVDALNAATTEERDPQVNAAARAALSRIAH